MRAARGTPSVAWVPPTTSARRVKVMPLEASVMGGFLRGIGWELSAFQAEIVKLSGQTQEQRNEQHRNDDLRRDEAEQAPGRRARVRDQRRRGQNRAEERRAGKEGVSRERTRWTRST